MVKFLKEKKYDKNHPVCLYQVHWWISSAVEAAVVAGPVRSERQLSVLGPRPAVSGPAQWPGCCRAAQVQHRLSAWSSGLWGLRYWWWEHWAGPHQLRTWGSGGQYWGSSAWLLRAKEKSETLKYNQTQYNIPSCSTATPARVHKQNANADTVCQAQIRVCWWNHSKDVEYFRQVIPNTNACTLWPLVRCSQKAVWYSENIKVRLNALNSSELNKYINPFRGRSISIFFWGLGFGWAKNAHSLCKDKNQRRQNKEVLHSVCVGRRDTSPGIMFFNMRAKQGQTNVGMW